MNLILPGADLGGGPFLRPGLDLDHVDVLTLVNQLPELADDLVDLLDLQSVEVLDSSITKDMKYNKE